MTALERKIARRTLESFQHSRRRLVVSLEPGDILGIRLERTRLTVRAPLKNIYIQMCQWHAAAVRREKKAKKGKR
jgi:ribosomal protein L18